MKDAMSLSLCLSLIHRDTWLEMIHHPHIAFHLTPTRNVSSSYQLKHVDQTNRPGKMDMKMLASLATIDNEQGEYFVCNQHVRLKHYGKQQRFNINLNDTGTTL